VEKDMITVVDRERIRRAFYVEGKSMREIAEEMRHGYWTIRKALESAEHQPYRLSQPKSAPKLDGYKAKVEELLTEEAALPRKQRYTTHRIYELMLDEGYSGSESNLRRYIGQRRRERRRPEIFIPLAFEPGQDAQVDWGEAEVVLAGKRVTVQLFVMRLCYSRRTFVMAFPNQKQEAFFSGHVEAFHFFAGVPHTLTYDNLKTAVRRILTGRNRQEQERFVAFRSHYLFDSRFCTPGQGHEKGGVESGVGYVRRNYLVPLPVVGSYAELNEWLRQKCLADDSRRVERQKQTIGQQWAAEKPHLRPLTGGDFPCYTSREVSLNRYGQVVFETNRYSVPAEQARAELTLRAYPFRIEILSGSQLIASHQRCYDREQDILNPLHYLPLLLERPGAFDHAAPLRQWRESWPPVYDELLRRLKNQQSEIRAVREFVQILQLHHEHEAGLVQRAIEQALADGVANLSGVRFCLHRLLDPTPSCRLLDLSEQPHLAGVGQMPLPLVEYNQLLRRVTA
jgi:transposase